MQTPNVPALPDGDTLVKAVGDRLEELVARHNERVTELLQANNVMEERARRAGREVKRLTLILTRRGLDQPAPRWRHLKRGGEYTEVGRGPLQASRGPIREGDAIVAYMGDDGRMFFREETEFEDGRFGEVL